MATMYRRQFCQQPTRNTHLNPQLYLHPSNILLNNINNKMTPSTTNHLPPTSQDSNKKVYIRRVKIGSSRAQKSKTDHSRCKSSEKNNRPNVEIPTKSQSVHKYSSAKSFVIRKRKYISLIRDKDQQPIDYTQIEFNQINGKLMKEINNNTEMIEKQFQSTTIKCKDTNKTNQNKSILKKQQEKTALHFDNTRNCHKQININLALLQTKKSMHFVPNNQSIRKKGKIAFENDPYPFDSKSNGNKQNIIEHSPNQNSQFLAKYQKHKSHKQFDRKQKVHSACKTIKVPWDQIKSNNQGHCQKLKKVRGQFKKTFNDQPFLKTQGQQNFLLKDISMIDVKSSFANGSRGIQSLKDLCLQLNINRGAKQE